MYIEAYALNNQEATPVAETLVERFILHFGIMEIVNMDQGANFHTKLITILSTLLHLHKS